MTEWVWIAAAALSFGALVQEVRVYKMRRNHRNQEEIFQVVTENAADMIALVDVKGHRLYNSPSYKRILGYSPAELSETSSFEQIHPEDRMRALEAARDARESGIGKRLEYRIKHKDGSWRVLESVATTIRNEKGEVAKLVIVNRDITERKRAEAQLEYNLFHDPLTGLPNRRMFLDRLQTAFSRARRDAGSYYALLLVNIDHFKVFNDTMGTQAGDQVLIDIGRRISGALRQELSLVQREPSSSSGDVMLFRLGGDEFAILLESVADPSDAMRTAKTLLMAVAEPLHIDSREVRASISIGIALNTQVHMRPEDALKDADVAMRRAKALGGSRCEVFDEAMHTRALGRLRLESDLRTALTERQFRIHYQPVVHLKTRRVVSFEALLRWEHPTRGLISPYRFIETAEDTGILVSIGHWLIVQACMQLRDWEMSARTEPMNITVNLSARQLADARLANDVQEALQQTGIDPSRLQLEMTEEVAAADSKLTVTVLSHLKHLGIKTVLDNFGTGSMSLLELASFPIDALKIDRSLVREMQADKSATDIVELIITLAHKMQFQAIAEGIETARQLQRLQELGCEYGQGYYFSQPMDAAAALRFMQQQVSVSQATRAGK